MSRYVAIGDSQTEGLLDPDGHGGYRGWADRFAAHLTAVVPHLQYANLAVRGRLIGAVRREQMAPALALEPDLVTVMAGLNDVMRPAFEPDAVLGELDAMLSELAAAGATAVTNTYPDPASLVPMFAKLAPRIAAFNDGIRRVTAARGALLVDFDAIGSGTDPRIWSADRIHANPVGHALIAAGFADAVGLPGFPGWQAPLPAGIEPGRLRRAAVDAQWLTRTVLPKIVRNARGRSSGDGRVAKRPRLLPVAALFHLLAPGDWPTAGRYRPPSLDAEGFVHLSFADQVAGSANRFYAEAPELAVVRLDPERLGVDVRVEDTYGTGAEFPHAYGPLLADAAVSVRALRRDDAGDWVFDAR